MLGIYDKEIELSLTSHASAVCAVRRVIGKPQIASTSRHLSQGAADLISVCWDDENLSLTGSSKVVKNDDYQIFIYVPDGYKPTVGQVIDNILTLKPDNSENKVVDWKVSFTKNT